MPSDLMDVADLKTLALARPQVTAAQLDQYLVYQRRLRDLLARPLAEAHQQALLDSGLSARDLPAIAAVCREFAGKRSTAAIVRERMEIAQAHGDLDTVASLSGQLQRLHAPLYWNQRYGAELTASLEDREEALVALHRALGTGS